MTERRQEILTVALRLLCSRGYAAFSYKDIAKVMGITTASLHYHFESKEMLGLALCDYIEEVQTRVASDLAHREPDDRAVLASFLRRWAVHWADGAICPIASLQSDLDALPPALQQRLAALSKFEIGLVARHLQRAADGGGLTLAGPTEEEAALLLAAYKGVALYSRVMGPSFRETMLGRIIGPLEPPNENRDSQL
jgi:TetR/AcrR family transcriptional repressor of nem operon